MAHGEVKWYGIPSDKGPYLPQTVILGIPAYPVVTGSRYPFDTDNHRKTRQIRPFTATVGKTLQ